MRTRQLRTIARHWWRSDGGDYWFERVSAATGQQPTYLPDLIRWLVRTAPPHKADYVGTSVVEDLVMTLEFQGRSATAAVPILLKAKLTPHELFTVLSGTWPRYCNAMDVRTGLGHLLSVAQLEWLCERTKNTEPGDFVA